MTDVRRVGKLIIIALDDGTWVRSHLAMSGLWSSREEPWSFDYVEGRREAGDERHARLILHTDRGQMVYHDQRMFGRMGHGPPDVDTLPGQGYEWIETERGVFQTAPPDWLHERLLESGDRPIRDFICDQNVLPGIGNIYSAEILWMLGVPPELPCRKVGPPLTVQLMNTSRQMLHAAIDRKLDYSALKIYRRKLCPVGHPVSSLKISGRTVYLCETCLTC